MKSQMTIGKKLMLAFGAMLALTLGLAYSSLTSVDSLGTELNTATTNLAKKSALVSQLSVGVANMSRAQRGLVLYSMLKQTAKAEEAGPAVSNNRGRHGEAVGRTAAPTCDGARKGGRRNDRLGHCGLEASLQRSGWPLRKAAVRHKPRNDYRQDGRLWHRSE